MLSWWLTVSLQIYFCITGCSWEKSSNQSIPRGVNSNEGKQVKGELLLFAFLSFFSDRAHCIFRIWREYRIRSSLGMQKSVVLLVYTTYIPRELSLTESIILFLRQRSPTPKYYQNRTVMKAAEMALRGIFEDRIFYFKKLGIPDSFLERECGEGDSHILDSSRQDTACSKLKPKKLAP